MEARRFGLKRQSRTEVNKLTPTIAMLAVLASTIVNRVTVASGDDLYDTEGNEPEERKRLNILQCGFPRLACGQGVSRSKISGLWNTVTSFLS